MFYLKEFPKNCVQLINCLNLKPINWALIVTVLCLSDLLKVTLAQPYRNPQRCSHRLENALEHMRRRSIQTKTSRSYTPQTPYTLYHSLYGPAEEADDDFYHPSNDRGYYAKNIDRSYRTYSRLDFDEALNQAQDAYQNQRQPHRLSVARVDVEDLKVRLPNENSAKWVEIDKCKFSSENSTLDTRLIFPDLTLSGKVVLQPTGGKCLMILRLRHAGIEFRTVPIGFEKTSHGEESRRVGAASVRTDSHFAEPGFISVFAHGCQGPTGIKLRQNSKRRYSFVDEQQPDLHTSQPLPAEVLFDIRSEGYIPPNMRDQDLDWSDTSSQEFFDPNGDNFYRHQMRYKRSAAFRPEARSRNRNQHVRDELNFEDDILNVADDKVQNILQPDARAFADIFSANTGTGGNTFNDQEDINDAMRTELEKLFSMGVRGLLTTYMQRALQPAIKETLMENMGYTISYG